MACSNERITPTRESKFYPSQNLYAEQNGKQPLTAVNRTDHVLQRTED